MRERTRGSGPAWQLGFDPPAPLVCADWRLEPLRPELAGVDHTAWSSCRERLVVELGWNGWPGPDFTVQDNVQDLAEHFAEFERNEAYAYSVMSGERCIGCVYIEPWMDGAQLAFWVVDDVLGREGEIVDSVLDWLVGWPVQAVVVPVRKARGRTVQQLTCLGLRRVPGPAGHVSFRR